jgi:hypothetical protein
MWMVLDSKQESGGTKHCKISDFQTIYFIRFMIQQKVINAVWQEVLANGRKYNTESELYIQAVTLSLSSLL